MELEIAVRGILDDFGNAVSKIRVNKAALYELGRAVEDLPGAVWLTRPQCLATLCVLCREEWLMRGRCLHIVASMLKKVLVDVDEALDPSLQCEAITDGPKHWAALRRRHPPRRSLALAEAEEAVLDGEVPFSLSGACTMIIDNIAPLVARGETIAVNICILALPFAREPSSGPSSQVIDERWRLPRIRSALEFIAVDSNQEEARVLALRLACALGNQDDETFVLNDKLALLCRCAISDAGLAINDPDFHAAILDLVPVNVAKAAIRGFTQASLAFPLLQAINTHHNDFNQPFEDLDTLVDALTAAVACAEKTSNQDIATEFSDESDQKIAFRSALLYGEDEDPSRERILIALAAECTEEIEAFLSGAKLAHVVTSAMGVAASRDRTELVQRCCDLILRLTALPGAVSHCAEGLLFRVIPKVLQSVLDETEQDVLLTHLALPGGTRLTTAHFRRKAEAAIFIKAPQLWRWLLRRAALSATFDERTRRAARQIVTSRSEMDPWRELLDPGLAGQSGLARFLFARDTKLRTAAASRLALQLGLDPQQYEDGVDFSLAVNDDAGDVVTPQRFSSSERNGNARYEAFIAALETARFHGKEIPLLGALATEACLAVLGGASISQGVRARLCESAIAALEDESNAVGALEALRALAALAWIYGANLEAQNTDRMLRLLLTILLSKPHMKKEAAVAVAAIAFDRRQWLDNDEDQHNDIHLLPFAVARRFLPAAAVTIWSDERLVWHAEDDDHKDVYIAEEEEDYDELATAVCRASVESQLGELRTPTERWAWSREAITKCVKAEAATNRHDFVEALRQLHFWLACRGKRAEEALAEGPWDRALRRTLQRAPRGVYERTALGHALVAMTAVVSEMDADDKRWPDLWQSLLHVVAPAALDTTNCLNALLLRADSECGRVSLLGQEEDRNEEDKINAELLDEQIACDFMYLLARLAERSDLKGQRSAAALVASPAGQLIAKLLLSENTERAVQSVALETIARIATALVDSPLPKSWAMLPERVIELAVRPHRDAFRGGALLRPAIACLRRLLACTDSSSPMLSVAVLTRLAADRDAVLRAGALTLMLDDDQHLVEVLIQMASDAGETPMVRGAALDTLARRSNLNEEALRPLVAVLLRDDFASSRDSPATPFAAPVFFGGAANFFLTLCESHAALAARGFALLSKYALDPELWHAERYASDVFRCAGLELGSYGIQVSEQRHAWSQAEQLSLAGKGWQSSVRRTWRKHASVSQIAATAIARGIRLVMSSTASEVLRKCVPGLTTTALYSLSTILPTGASPLFTETAELIVTLLGAGGLDDAEIDEDELQQLVVRAASTAARILAEEEAPAPAVRGAARLTHALCAHKVLSFTVDDSTIMVTLAEALSQRALRETNDDDEDAIWSVKDSVALALAHVCELNAEARCLSHREALISKVLTDIISKADRLQQVSGVTSSNTHRKRELATDARAILRALVLLRPLFLSPNLAENDKDIEAVIYALARAWEGLETADKVGLVIGRTCFDEQLKRRASTSPLLEAALALIGVIAQCETNSEDSEDDLRRALVLAPPSSTSERTRKRSPALILRVTELAVRVPVGSAQSGLASQRQARLSVAACRCIAPLAASPARSALLQGGFVGDLVQALRALAAAANGPSLATVGRREAARAARARALELIRLLIALTMFPDTQAKVLLHSDTPDLLLDLAHYYAPSKSTSSAGCGSSPTSIVDDMQPEDDNTDDDEIFQPEQSKTKFEQPFSTSSRTNSADNFAEAIALLLRNLSLLRRNKGHVLAQPPLVRFLVSALASNSDAVFAAAATALWALVHHSEKARAQLKRDDFALRHLAAARIRIQRPLETSSTAHRAVYALCDILSANDNEISPPDISSPF